MKILVYTPAPLITGGPENCHQICAAFRDRGIDCRIQYFRTNAPSIEKIDWIDGNIYLEKYNTVSVKAGDVFDPTHVIYGAPDKRFKSLHLDKVRAVNWNVTPSFCRAFRGIGLVRRMFKRNEQYQYYSNLLVDAVSACGAMSRRAHWLFEEEQKNTVHLCQSYSAYTQLLKLGKEPALLFDYLHKEFFDEAKRPKVAKTIDVVYQKRSLPYAETVLKPLGLRTKLLKGLSREEMIDTIHRSKCYLDLGNHPGRDRIPREAVVCGAVALVGKFGTADRFADVPILPELRLNRWDVRGIRETVMEVVNNHTAYAERQSYFQEEIRSQQAEFEKQINNVITALAGAKI